MVSFRAPISLLIVIGITTYIESVNCYFLAVIGSEILNNRLKILFRFFDSFCIETPQATEM